MMTSSIYNNLAKTFAKVQEIDLSGHQKQRRNIKSAVIVCRNDWNALAYVWRNGWNALAYVCRNDWNALAYV